VLGVTHVIASNPPALPDASERFWGIRTPGTPFTSVVLRKSTEGDGLGLDEVLHTDLGAPDHGAATWTDLGSALPGGAGTPHLSGIGRLSAGSSNALQFAHFQFWIADAGGPQGFAASNALAGISS